MSYLGLLCTLDYMIDSELSIIPFNTTNINESSKFSIYNIENYDKKINRPPNISLADECDKHTNFDYSAYSMFNIDGKKKTINEKKEERD